MSERAKPDTKEDSRSKRRGFVGFLFGVFALPRGLVYLLGLAWAGGAVYFDGPIADDVGTAILAIGYVLVVLFTLASLTKPSRRFVGWVCAMVIVVVPWLMVKPTNEGDWQPQWAKVGWAKIDGDLITFHNFRNFDYGLDGTVTEHWEGRTVRLSKLRGLDYFHHAFGGDLLAHPVISFDFGEDGHVAFSIESRRQVGEGFLPVKGLYKQYGLIYIVGDERDFIRERATIRDEPVRLYRAAYSESRIREMFLETVGSLNELKEKPRFYNTVTANCTTSYRAQASSEKRARLDYRLLVNGKLEALLYERQVIVSSGLSLDELLKRASINEAAKAAHDDPKFSQRIREGRPGF